MGGRGTEADVAVVGAGIVGLASAVAVQRRRPGATVVVLDKEGGPARHQTGHNSGVVHSGLYYAPGSTKARLVADGRRRLERFCDERSVPYERCGKVVVAASAPEVAALAGLERRAAANGVEVERIGPARLHPLEPHVHGDAALFVPSTAITDYGAVAEALAAELVERGGELRTGWAVDRVTTLDHGRTVELGAAERRVRTRWWVNCAGLHSDRIARLAHADGPAGNVSIVPFRGEYHELVPAARHLVRHLVYPVPDPRWPFLGVHMTRMVDGSVHVGPNAVLALGREAYRGGVQLADAGALARDRGLWRLGARYWRTGVEELARSRSRRLLLADVRRLLPEVGDEDLVRSGAGIRAQALAADGTLLDDFAFARSGRGVHVVNAPSPAATASLAIAEVVADELDRMVDRRT
jgi:L-2-hydroxyglutarate oxidase LhgO